MKERQLQKGGTQRCHIQGQSSNLPCHSAGEHRGSTLFGRLLQIAFHRRFAGKGQPCQRVHDDVDPQHLYHRYRGVHAQKRPQNGHCYRRQIHGQLKDQKPLDGAENGTPVQNRPSDGGNIVVQNENISGFLCYPGAAAHGEAHVGQPQGGRIVDAVTRHAHHIARLLGQPYQTAFVGGQRPCHHPQPRQNLLHLPVGHGGKVGRGEDLPAASQQTCLLRDGFGGVGTVTGDHHHLYACPLNLSDGGCGFGPQAIPDECQAQQHQTAAFGRTCAQAHYPHPVGSLLLPRRSKRMAVGQRQQSVGRQPLTAPGQQQLGRAFDIAGEHAAGHRGC